MSSIFISHSSRDNATAADLTAWLEKNRRWPSTCCSPSAAPGGVEVPQCRGEG